MFLSRDLTLRTTASKEILVVAPEVLSLNPDSIITTYVILVEQFILLSVFLTIDFRVVRHEETVLPIRV